MANPKLDPYFDKDVAGGMEVVYAKVQSVSFHCPYCDVTLQEVGNFVWHVRHWPNQKMLKCHVCSRELKVPDFREFFEMQGNKDV